MNTTPAIQPEFGVYTIAKDYIAHLRKAEPLVMDPNVTNTYCGPVARRDTKRGPVDYFVPIDVAFFHNQKYFVTSFFDGVFAGMFDFTKMIPCLPSEYEFNETNLRLKDFCKLNEEQLRRCAEHMFTIFDREQKSDK